MPTPPTQLSRLGLTRRAALGLLVAGLAGTACEPMTVEPDSAESPTGPATDSPAPELEPDVPLAAAALAAEIRMAALVNDTAGRHPSLRQFLASTSRTHRRHIQLLTDAVPDDARDAPPGTRRTRVASPAAVALAQLADREVRLATELKATAFDAESGEFARLLASMSAAAAQQEVVLRTRAEAGS